MKGTPEMVSAADAAIIARISGSSRHHSSSPGDDVDFVVEAFGEQRTDRTVDQAGNQRFLFGRAALTLEKAAGDAAGRRIFFLIVNGQREESPALPSPTLAAVTAHSTTVSP
jgi:hypothetical protein